MAQRAVRPDTTVIDPLFFIPDGVEELQYKEGISVVPDDVDENEFEVDIDVDLSDSTETDDTDYTDAPEVPQVVGVISQTIRRDSAGVEVVDVVFNVTDSANGDSYEIRVTPV